MSMGEGEKKQRLNALWSILDQTFPKIGILTNFDISGFCECLLSTFSNQYSVSQQQQTWQKQNGTTASMNATKEIEVFFFSYLL